MTDRPTEQEDTSSPFSSRLEHAIELSAQWHDQTYRKSAWREQAFEVPSGFELSVPVVAHVTSVAMTLQRAGWDEVTVAAAFLHDVIEDRNRWEGRFSPRSLEHLVGPEVTGLVMQVSEKKLDSHGRSRSWRERKVDYVEGLRSAPDEAVAISIADKLHNLWTINESLASGLDMFDAGSNRGALNGSPEEQLWLVTEVLHIADGREDPRLGGLRRQLRTEIDRFRELTNAA